jgi:hypothetical protein
METVSHNVSDLAGSDRTAAERLVGHPLSDEQRIVIQVENPPIVAQESNVDSDSDKLPEWCNVYEGLTDDQIRDLERAISRRLDLTRQSK